MAKQDRHLTTARLSAFIDGQLSSEEQAQSETHLHDCKICQRQLAELRQTVELLRALPRPALPRSFALPTAEPIVAPRVTRIVRPLAPITPLPRRSGWPAYVTGAVRVASTLAAVVGIVFLLSGLFGTVINVRGGSANSGSSTIVNAPGNGAPQGVTPHMQGTEHQDMTPSPTPTTVPSVRSTHKNANNTAHQNQLQPLLAIFDVSMAGSRAILGIVLLVLGIIGFIVLRAAYYPG
ncbi:MAG: hypothetical protein NVSMB38_03790 [Ktedonobacteraceae bacterium]